ncbi:MAG: TIGR01212 family radical SAM protein [Planctomycetaceae bacterium]|nr:TIGR01212 family radical SAM protein [Planctomycetaceae bacterium]
MAPRTGTGHLPLYEVPQVQSTKPLTPDETGPSWRTAGLRFYSYNHFIQQRFRRRVQKVSVDAGFTCPNVDGSVAIGGCTFCDNRSFSPSRRLPRSGILGQIDQSLARMRGRYPDCRDFLAYFQPATNTYGPLDKLRRVYAEALSHPQVVGLAIGTRSDCVGEEVLDLLAELARSHFVSVEYGMQTMHDRSLQWMNRGHDHASSVDAIERSRGRGFEIGVHVMLGLPGESRADMLATAREVARLRVDSVKIHNLYCVKKTKLAEEVAAGEVTLMGRADYVRTVVDFLELLPPDMVVERVTGDAPPDYFVGPAWSLDKGGVRQEIDAEFARRDSWQGKRWSEPTSASAPAGSL